MKQIKHLKLKLRDLDRTDTSALEDNNKGYDDFQKIFLTYYNEILPKVKV